MVEFTIQLKFPDHFGFSVRIFVSSSMSTVDDVKKYISVLFGIDNNFYLTIHGDVLHPKENIKVLYPWATVTARKGSFLVPFVNVVPKGTCFDRFKRSCIKFTDGVAKFIGMSKSEELPPLNQNATLNHYLLDDLLAGLTYEEMLQFVMQQLTLMDKERFNKYKSEEAKKTLKENQNGSAETYTEPASHSKSNGTDCNKDEDSDEDFMIVD